MFSLRSLTLRSFLCVALGLATTVAIAWACAAFVAFSDDRPWESATLRQDGAMEWKLVQEAFGRTRIAYIIGPPVPAGDALHVPLMDAFSILRPDDAGSIDEVGWPFAALSCRSPRISIASATLAAQVTISGRDLEGGFPLPDRVRAGAREWRALPYQPIWIGLILDVLVFGIAWMAILRGSGPVRSWIRRFRGRCPTCGYDVRAQFEAGCPECGWNRDVNACPAQL